MGGKSGGHDHSLTRNQLKRIIHGPVGSISGSLESRDSLFNPGVQIALCSSTRVHSIDLNAILYGL